VDVGYNRLSLAGNETTETLCSYFDVILLVEEEEADCIWGMHFFYRA